MNKQLRTAAKMRQDAWQLLTQYTASVNLRKHALAVEAAMRYYARILKEDKELWGIVGLLHDFDYEQYPDLKDHPYRGQEILAQEGFSSVVQKAIMAHAPHTGTPRATPLEKTIFAVDELTGLIVAVALVRPNNSLAEVDVTSIKKKMKQKAFAAGVSRDDIQKGAEEMGLSLDKHLQNVLSAMQGVAEELGL